MNASRMSLFAILGVYACSLPRPALATPPDSTAFEYQGHVTHDGLPVTDTCDFRASLWPSESGGSKLDETVAQDVDVTGGVFAIDVDFGSEAFGGSERWLSIEALCPYYDPVFRVIGPRQAVGAVPYAIHTRGINVTEGGNVGIGTGSPEARLHVDGSFRQGSNGEFNVDAPNVVGGRMKVKENGNVGIGTSQPFSPLHVRPHQSGTAFVVGGDPSNGGFTAFEIGLSALTNGFVDLQAISASGSAWGNIIMNRFGGNVGIGRTSPQAKLDVAGGIAINGSQVIDAQGQWVGGAAPGAPIFAHCARGILLCGTLTGSYNGPLSPTQADAEAYCASVCTHGYSSASSAPDSCSISIAPNIGCGLTGGAFSAFGQCGPPGCNPSGLNGPFCIQGRIFPACCACKQ